MKFGIFYELQLPRPWQAGDELKLYQDALTQLETADRLGYDHAWVVEHHFLEEYSHSPSPESFLGGVRRAFETFTAKDRLDSMRRSAMARSFSWDLSAALYSTLYRKTVGV